MEKKRPLTRLERLKRERESQQTGRSTLKNILRGTTVLIISVTLVSCSLNLPYMKAYFTDKITYSGNHSSDGSLRSLSSGAIKLLFNIHRFNDLDMELDLEPEGNVLVAVLGLPEGCGFDAGDIIGDAIKFIYDGREIKSITPYKVTKRAMKITIFYDWSEIDEQIAGSDNNPNFTVSGKGEGPGVSGLGEKFTFSGHGQIHDLSGYFAVPEEPVEIQEEMPEEVLPEPDVDMDGEGVDKKDDTGTVEKKDEAKTDDDSPPVDEDTDTEQKTDDKDAPESVIDADKGSVIDKDESEPDKSSTDEKTTDDASQTDNTGGEKDSHSSDEDSSPQSDGATNNSTATVEKGDSEE